MSEQYLIDREQAVERYGISMRTLEALYHRYKDFPVIRVGKKVMVFREAADRWFSEWMGETVDL